MTTVELAEEPIEERRLPLAALRSVPYLGVYAGLAVILLGCVLLAIAWGRVAGLTSVGLQTPYVISAGCVGLGVVAVGLAIVNVAVKVSDARARAAQLDELRETLVSIREAMEGQR